MEPERDEVYERIPWETLERQGGNRQWIVYAIAGAVTLGALAYSFTRNLPVMPEEAAAPVVTTIPVATTASPQESASATVAAPIVVSEADLYAVEPERLIDQVVAHAEWFAVEYMAVDGTEQSRAVLRSLLPEGIPLPEAETGVQVFVDWVRAGKVEQTSSDSFEVEVTVRFLTSSGEGGFSRRPPVSLLVPVSINAEGAPVVSGAPGMTVAQPAQPVAVSLAEVPPEVAEDVAAGEVVGGVQTADGEWVLVVMTEDDSGVRRPVSFRP